VLALLGQATAAVGFTSRVSVSGTGTQAIGGGTDPTISADGRYVAFSSAAPNLVPKTPTTPPTRLSATG